MSNDEEKVIKAFGDVGGSEAEIEHFKRAQKLKGLMRDIVDDVSQKGYSKDELRRIAREELDKMRGKKRKTGVQDE